MGIEFGKNARKQIARGDLVASFQYVNGEEAVVLWRLNTLNSSLALKNYGAVVIGLSCAFKYADDDYLVKQSRTYAKVMGFGDTAREAHKIATFIQDMLIELCTMKPIPESLEEKEPGEVSIRGNKVDIILH
jgi:hypothetical protein